MLKTICLHRKNGEQSYRLLQDCCNEFPGIPERYQRYIATLRYPNINCICESLPYGSSYVAALSKLVWLCEK
jgi:hypothetical protein